MIRHSTIGSVRGATSRNSSTAWTTRRSRRARSTEATRVFRRWLGDEYDLDALDATLATAAAEKLAATRSGCCSSPAPGNAKTETVQALAGAGAYIVVDDQLGRRAAFGHAGQAAGEERHRRAAPPDRRPRPTRHQGRDVDPVDEPRHARHGARRDPRDPRRTMGTQPRHGRRPHPRLDRPHRHRRRRHHRMGPRPRRHRLDGRPLPAPADGLHRGPLAAGRQSRRNVGHEEQMRAELPPPLPASSPAPTSPPTPSSTTTRPRRYSPPPTSSPSPAPVSTTTTAATSSTPTPPNAHPLHQATRATRARRRRHRHGPGRRLASPSAAPATRCRPCGWRSSTTSPSTRIDIHRGPARLDKPRATVDRQLQALHILGVLRLDEDERDDGKTTWRYSLAEGIDPSALRPSPDLSVQVLEGVEKRDRTSRCPTDKSGDGHEVPL